MSGHHNVCANIRFLATRTIPAFSVNWSTCRSRTFAHPRRHVVRRSRSGRASRHCPAFPAPGVHRPGETVAVIGAGPIGLLTIAALRAAKAGRIWAVEPLAHRRELARGIGADVVLEPGEAVEEILRATGSAAWTAPSTARPEQTPRQAIQLARNAGRVALTGIHSTPMVSVDGSAMRRKELTIFNVRRSNHETEEALALLQAQPDWFAPLLTHTRPLDRIDEAFAIASQYRDGVGKMVIQP